MSATSVPSLVPPDSQTYQTCLDSSVLLVKKILSVQAQSIHHVSKQYQHSDWSINQLVTSLKIMNNALISQNKIIVTGIGKSFKIASKIVATLNSLSLHSSILHPSDALHGDLGLIRDNDCLILISASGSSSELVDLIAHLDQSKLKIILLTCNANSSLANHPKISSLIYAELPTRYKEENVYGLTAPTISTTLLLSLMDSVSIALSQLHINDANLRKRLFGERHPGGAIGQLYSSSSSSDSLNLLNFNIKSIPVNEDYNDVAASATNTNNTKTLPTITALSMEALQKRSPNAKFKYLEKFPDDLPQLFDYAIKYDYVVLGGENNNKIINTNEMISLIRQIDDEKVRDNIIEMKWRILEQL